MARYRIIRVVELDKYAVRCPVFGLTLTDSATFATVYDCRKAADYEQLAADHAAIAQKLEDDNVRVAVWSELDECYVDLLPHVWDVSADEYVPSCSAR
jgi:hypothetical protein